MKNSDDQLWKEIEKAAEEYEQAFGEAPALMELPGDPVECLSIIKQAIKRGRPYDPYQDGGVPNDAVI